MLEKIPILNECFTNFHKKKKNLLILGYALRKNNAQIQNQ